VRRQRARLAVVRWEKAASAWGQERRWDGDRGGGGMGIEAASLAGAKRGVWPAGRRGSQREATSLASGAAWWPAVGGGRGGCTEVGGEP
jgi:hypothetical protein